MGWEVGGFGTHSFTRSHFPICLLVFLSILFLKECSSYPNGLEIPSDDTCVDMRPVHGDFEDQGSEHPFLIESLNETFTPEGLIRFRVSANLSNCFTGIFAQVRTENRVNPVGRFPPDANPDFLTPYECNSRPRSTITHTDARSVCNITLAWKAPNLRRDRVTSVFLVVTIVESFEKFWVQLRSPSVPLAQETLTTPSFDVTTSRNKSSQSPITSTTALTSSTWPSSDSTIQKFSTEAGSYDETSPTPMDLEEISSTIDRDEYSTKGDDFDSRGSHEVTERPTKTEPTLSKTSKYKQSTAATPGSTFSMFPPTKTSESKRQLETTQLSSSTTDIFVDGSSPDFLPTLTTVFYTEADDATPTLETSNRRTTDDVTTNVMSTEEIYVGDPITTTKVSVSTEVTNPATTKYESLTTTSDISTSITHTTELSTANNEISTPSLTTSLPFLSDFLITTDLELSTTSATTTDGSETASKGNAASTYGSSSSAALSTPIGTTEGLGTTPFDQTENGLMSSEGSLTSLTTPKNSAFTTPMQTLGRSTETEFVTTEKDSTTPTPNFFTTLVLSRSVVATEMDGPSTHRPSALPTMTSVDLLTEKTISTDISQSSTGLQSTRQDFLSTFGGDELTTVISSSTAATEMDSPSTQKPSTLPITTNANLLTEKAISTDISQSTTGLQSTRQDFLSTFGGDELTTVISSSTAATEMDSPSTQKPSTLPITINTNLLTEKAISTDISQSTTGLQSTNQDFLSTLGGDELTTNGVLTTSNDAASTFLTTLTEDFGTEMKEMTSNTQQVDTTTSFSTETFFSTYSLTTQIDLTTPYLPKLDSTDVATESFTGTSPQLISEPATDLTTLVDNTSVSSSTQKLTTYKRMTRSNNGTIAPTVDEEVTTEEMETTSEDFTTVDNKMEETVTSEATSTSTASNAVLTDEVQYHAGTSDQSDSSSTAKSTVSTKIVTTVSTEMRNTERETNTSASMPSTRSMTTATTHGISGDITTQNFKTTGFTGTEIVMGFEIENYPFNSSLMDTNSSYYKKLDNDLAMAIQRVYSTMENKPKNVTAKNFTSGSVIAVMSTVYESTLNEDEMTNAVLVMYNHVTNDMFDDSFNVSEFWIIENGNRVTVDLCYGTKCPTGLNCSVDGSDCVQYCSENPGLCDGNQICLGYPENVTISCECAEGFSGEQCTTSEVTVSSFTRGPNTGGDDSVMTLAVTLGIVGGVLLIVIFILTFGLICLVRAKPKPLLPVSVNNNFPVIPRFPTMIPLHRMNSISIDDSDSHDGFENTTTTTDHPFITNEGGVRSPTLPDLVTSTTSIPDWENDIVSSRRSRRQGVSFSNIREVLEADDSISIETFSFGRSYVTQEEDNGQTIFRWRMESTSGSTPSRDEAPT